MDADEGGTAVKGVGVQRVGQIAINVKDVSRATAFYRDVVGLRHLFEAGGMSFFDCGGVRLLLGVAEAGEFDHPSSIIYFDVPDIEAAHRSLQGRGATIERPPERVADLGDRTLWLSFFRDTETNMMALMSEVPKGGCWRGAGVRGSGGAGAGWERRRLRAAGAAAAAAGVRRAGRPAPAAPSRRA